MYRKVQEFTEQFSKLNIGVFSYGTMHNEELRKGVRLPQIIIRKRLQGERGRGWEAAEVMGNRPMVSRLVQGVPLLIVRPFSVHSTKLAST